MIGVRGAAAGADGGGVDLAYEHGATASQMGSSTMLVVLPTRLMCVGLLRGRAAAYGSRPNERRC